MGSSTNRDAVLHHEEDALTDMTPAAAQDSGWYDPSLIMLEEHRTQCFGDHAIPKWDSTAASLPGGGTFEKLDPRILSIRFCCPLSVHGAVSTDIDCKEKTEHFTFHDRQFDVHCNYFAFFKPFRSLSLHVRAGTMSSMGQRDSTLTIIKLAVTSQKAPTSRHSRTPCLQSSYALKPMRSST